MVNVHGKRSMNRRTFGALSAGTGVAIATRVSAQEATPQLGSTPEVAGTPEATSDITSEVLASGLLDPRFIAIDGTDIYFTESGSGGDDPVILNVGEGTPEATEPVSVRGNTGKVSRLSADGTITEIANDLISYTFGANGEIVGAAGIALDSEGNVLVAVGAPGPYISDLPRNGEEGVVLKINIETGEREIIGDLLQWELDNNPDPATYDSNPYGMALLDGIAYIADAGGNTIIAVDTTTNEVSTFAVPGGFETEMFGEGGNPGRGGAQEIDSVPSSVTVGPDGRLYVAYTTGGPFPAGIAPVDAFSADGTEERVVEGLTMSSDIAFDSTGRMYVSIVSTNLIEGGPGQVVRIEDDGTYSVILDGLAMPAGIAFDADDNLYVIENSSIVPGGGSLVKYSGVVDAAGTTGTDDTVATPVASTDTPAGDFHIDMIDTAFEPNALTIPANQDVVITFENKGFLAHDFVLDDPKVVSDVLTNGGTTEVTLNLAPGEYTFYCSQVGHRALGMEGKLTVE